MEQKVDLLDTLKKIIILNNIKVIQLNEINFIGKIGEGGQAKVYKASYNNNIVAVKVMRNLDFKCFAHELVIIALLKHPNIPKFYGIVFEQNIISLVFEFIDGKTLEKFDIKSFNLEQKYKIIYELSSILEYMHQNKSIHRDLKPENLMMTNNKIYLIDFGIAKVCTVGDSTNTRAKGTINYLAPESFVPSGINEDEQIISKITPKVDVWAFGCIVSWLFSGYIPWSNKYKDSKPIIQKALMKKIPFVIPKEIENNLFVLKIVQLTTQIEPENRPDMIHIKKLIEDECIKIGIQI